MVCQACHQQGISGGVYCSGCGQQFASQAYAAPQPTLFRARQGKVIAGVCAGLADTQRGYNDIRGAANGYLQAAEQPNCSDWLRKRAQLNAGEMDDLLGDRAGAVRMYQMAAASGGDQSQAEAAKKYLKTPFSGK